MKPLALLSAIAVVMATCAPLAHAGSFSLGVIERNVAIGVHLSDAPIVAYRARPYCAPRRYAPPAVVYPSAYWIPHRYYGGERQRHHWDRERYDRHDEWRHRRGRDDDHGPRWDR